MSDYYLRVQSPVAPPDSVAGVKSLLGWADRVATAALPTDVYRHKEGRITLRFSYEGRGYFLKLHRGVGWGEIFKNLVQARLPIISASNEYRAVQTLREVGVDTLALAAYASHGSNPATVKSLVVSDELVNTISLEHYCADWAVAPPDPALRMRLIRKLAETARRMHGAGINHRDFYLCHFHLDLSSLAEPELRCHLIDLHRAQLRGYTPRRWQIKDLAGLYFSALGCGLAKRDLLRFMHHYSEGGLAAALGPDLAFWREVQRKAHALLYKGEFRKAGHQGAVANATARVMRGRGWGATLAARVAGSPCDLQHWLGDHGRLLKADRWSEAGLIELQGQPCFIKLYRAKSALHRLGFRLGRGRALRSFDAAQAMRASGLPVPEPRACVTVPGAMLLLTESLPGGRDLRELWRAGTTATNTTAWMEAAANLLARLHSAGFAHGDCKWSNLLWSQEQFLLVDLDAVREVSLLLDKSAGLHSRQARDLARFTIDAEELALPPDAYQLFLDRYLASTGLARKQVLAQLLPLLEKIRARHRRKYAVSPAPLLEANIK